MVAIARRLSSGRGILTATLGGCAGNLAAVRAG